MTKKPKIINYNAISYLFTSMSAVNPPGNPVLKERSFSQRIHQNLKKKERNQVIQLLSIWNQPLGVLYINMDEGSHSETVHNLYKSN